MRVSKECIEWQPELSEFAYDEILGIEGAVERVYLFSNLPEIVQGTKVTVRNYGKGILTVHLANESREALCALAPNQQADIEAVASVEPWYSIGAQFATCVSFFDEPVAPETTSAPEPVSTETKTEPSPRTVVSARVVTLIELTYSDGTVERVPSV